jgi:DNA-binding NarL/FixJ family response regulator
MGRNCSITWRTWLPDVILLDLRMPNTDGLTALQTLNSTKIPAKVIILTASDDKNEFVQAMKLGCAGIVLKQTSADLIVKSIRKVHAGEIWLDAHHGRRNAAVRGGDEAAARREPESKAGSGRRSAQREREIVALVAQGYKNKEMAEKMFIRSRR